MKIVIFGAGGIGGYFGARLAAAGCEVHFIARGAHLDAIRKNGLRVQSQLGDLHINPALATDNPDDVGIADVVMLMVKLYDTENAARAMAPMVGPATMVVSFQNGVTASDVLVDAFGRDRVIGGTTNIGVKITEPGQIDHTGTMAKITFGELDGSLTKRTKALLAAFEKAGCDAELSADITASLWAKFIFLSTLSGITSLYRQPIGPIRDDPEKWQKFRHAMEETYAVAIARGVTLAPDLVEQRLEFVCGLPAEMNSSMCFDLMAGKRLELPWLSGAVADMGRQLAVETPTHDEFVAALTDFIDGD
ncbi:MAG: 2-dehydropantoate 2-reductase [Proteobacteria bacterium]|nr:2-dehydropantoate 2-reductase [Pseudomonadota bacterium]MDA1021888.1 2-dehydropantoate 2-reductase [Pseudomonadota bacterium]